jgi:ATPase subunit of ABC transporter with duplicated ATPase domains
VALARLLIEALARFDGALIAVSHDRTFLQAIHTERVIAL